MVLEGVVDVGGEEPVVRRCHKKILMLIWKSIMTKQSRTIEGIYHVLLFAYYNLLWPFAVWRHNISVLCISTKIFLDKRGKRLPVE